MCGINGYVSLKGDFPDLHVMNHAIAHRGPDHGGVWSSNNSGFSHVRLSIQDLSSRANQPLQKNGITIVFNGEIYNFREIRSQLSHQCQFITDSDTEVVLEAWRCWGDECLKRFRGMYAFAIYDKRSQRASIIRDPFGIKPLFYYQPPQGGIIFSSELKALEAVCRDKFTVNQKAVASSLLYVWLPESACIWNEVKKLPPGYYISINDDGNAALKPYAFTHEFLLNKKPLYENEREVVDNLNQVIFDSVQSHLIADVPINAFLSGGLDSSLLVAMARSELYTLDCYTIKFPASAKKAEAMSDDSYYARKVAEFLDVKLHVIEAEPDVYDLLPKIVHHLDEPVGDSAAINTFLICNAARSQGVKVLLSGMGADELFGGYRKHYANLLARSYRRFPRIMRKPLEFFINRLPVSVRGRGLVPMRWAKRFLSFAGLPEADAFFRSYSYYDRDALSYLLPQVGAEAFDLCHDEYHKIFSMPFQRDLVDKMCYSDVNMFMVSLNETYTDRASMAASTEIRVPFIDKKVIDYAFRIHPGLKIKNGVGKYVLKKVAEKWLPKEIIYRPKSSFSLPLRSWISGQFIDMVDEYILSACGLAGRDGFNTPFLQKLVDDDRAGYQDNAQKIWQLLTVEQWFRNHGI